MENKKQTLGLPPKETSIFKRICKCYEQKMYKNGLKLTKQILNNSLYAEHAETLSMKGLILNALGRREEGFEIARRGLKNNLQSYTCWNVFGLLQRSDRKYEEALKCYRNALKWSPNSTEIWGEMSTVQIHVRDLNGFLNSKQHLFRLKPTQRTSWLGLAIAYHLVKNYDMAYKVIDAFRKTLKPKDLLDGTQSVDYENSELLLYQNTLLQEKGDFGDALNHLRINCYEICDKATLNEYFGIIYFKLGYFEEAAEYYQFLIQAYPDDLKFHQMYVRSLGIEHRPNEIVKLYESFGETNKGTSLILKYSEGEEFERYLRPFVQKMLSKGAPSLFVELRNLYDDEEKKEIIENILLEIVEQLERNGRYHELDVEEAPPSALIWSYYFLAQHYDYLENIDTAMEYVDKAIDHTPTVTELFICKARIHKHSGEFEKAAECMDEARELDTSDRCTTSKSAKYHLRANNISNATNIYGKFTRDGKSAMDDANEMQCIWFQLECALAYQRTGQWGEALKKCHEIDRHFTNIIDDQFDFHVYSIRKVALRSYMKLLRYEDNLRSHAFYFKAAKCAIEVYLHLFDDSQTEADSNHDREPNSANSENNELPSNQEAKKLTNKMKKMQKKAEAELRAATVAVQKKEQHVKSKQKQGTGQEEENDEGAPKLEQLKPDTLANTPDPLRDAVRFLEPLHSFAHSQIETHLLAYEIYRRRGKALLMFRSIKRALKCTSATDNPTLTEFVTDFNENIVPQLNHFPEVVDEFVQRQMETINTKDTSKLTHCSIGTVSSRPGGGASGSNYCWRKAPQQFPYVPRIYDRQRQRHGPESIPHDD